VTLLSALVLSSFCAQPQPSSAPSPPIVVGLLGGFERAHDPNRGVRKLVVRLLETPGIQAESFSNYRRRSATRYILRSLDRNRDGKLDREEKANARIVLYGQSLGGAQVVAIARDLDRRGIPVLLTVQIDSFGLRDSRIPPNVKAAANYYQKEILTFRGESEIRAVDPTKTKILANIRFHYPPFLPSYSRPESWARRKLGGAHAKLEADPVLWVGVEAMIRHAIATAN
jgi:hypothetical protein